MKIDEEDGKGKEVEDRSSKNKVYLYDMDVWSNWISFLESSKRNDDINQYRYSVSIATS